jgi:hypothetical protein
MKLLYCRLCGDIFSLDTKLKQCGCGDTKGLYMEDKLNAEYSGVSAMPLGITNMTFREAVRMQPEDGMGYNFVAFVIPKECPTFKWKKKITPQALPPVSQ